MNIRKIGWMLGILLLLVSAGWLIHLDAADADKTVSSKKTGKKWKLPPPPKPFMPDGTPFNPAEQREAEKRAADVPPVVKKVLEERLSERKHRLMALGLGLDDVKHSYELLNSPIIRKEEDRYSPVRFMHLKHASVVGDCSACHHLRPADPKAPETVKCSACHRSSFDPSMPERMGLKGAYHRRCMGCHKEWNRGPVGCTDCHSRNVPDHTELVKLPSHPKPEEVTRECLRCHDAQAEDMLKSAHWLWRGPSPCTLGNEKRIDMGKATNTINNFCIALASNWPRCTSCHPGYGWKDAGFDFTDKTKIDCLVCHDTTNTYRKLPPGAGMPYPEVDLVNVARHVGKPSRKNCGDCHFQGGGGDAVKHGDMNSVLYYPSRNCDVHMGGLDFQCRECHKTRNHRIPGRSLSVPVAEGSRSCEYCHTSKPHVRRPLLAHHLNRHVAHVACTTCHSPIFAKCKPTKVWWDWSKAGDKNRKPKKDRYGMPDYMWKKGEFRWKESAKPVYRWYNGWVKRYLIGDRITTEGVVKLTEPVGDMRDPCSKIYPFKTMRGRQGADAEYHRLLVPHLFGPGGYWKTLDWQRSYRDGMKAVGLPYSGKYKWVETVMYWGLNHEITPKERALSCVQCHPSLKGDRSCARCHQDNRQVDFRKLAYHGIDFKKLYYKGRDVLALVNSTDYLDFKSLGYQGDPILFGGRFKRLPLGTAGDRP